MQSIIDIVDSVICLEAGVHTHTHTLYIPIFDTQCLEKRTCSMKINNCWIVCVCVCVCVQSTIKRAASQTNRHWIRQILTVPCKQFIEQTHVVRLTAHSIRTNSTNPIDIHCLAQAFRLFEYSVPRLSNNYDFISPCNHNTAQAAFSM